MAGRVDQVQFVLLTIIVRIEHAHGLGLDRDPLLPLQVHAVQHLLRHLAAGDGPGLLEQAIRQRRFAVIDMGNDAKVADLFELVGHRSILLLCLAVA